MLTCGKQLLLSIVESRKEIFGIINFINGLRNYYGFGSNLPADFTQWHRGIYDFFIAEFRESYPRRANVSV